MVRRSTDTHTAAMARLPHRAMFRREEPLRPSDRDRLEAVVKSIAAGSEHLIRAGSRGEELDCTVVHFDCSEKARELQAWFEASGISRWPARKPRTDIEQLKVGG